VEVTPLSSGKDAAYAYIATERLQPGTYEVSGTAEETTFSVGDWGTNPAFDPQSIVGHTYRMSPIFDYLVVPREIGPLLQQQIVSDHYIEFFDGGSTVDFRVILEDDNTTCLLLESTGELSETGEFTWSADELVAETTPRATTLQDLWLHLGFDADGTAAKGVEGGVWLDTRTMGATANDACDLVATFGVECHDCIGDQVDSCVFVAFHHGELAVSDGEFEEDMPFCTAVLADDLNPDFDCNGCQTGKTGAPVAPMVLLLWLRRRRKQINRQR
jgi:hypothetical protein